MDKEQAFNKKSMKRRFDIGYECKSYEEFLKIRESILKPQPIPEPLQNAVEYATRKILYDDETTKNKEHVVIASIGCLEVLLKKKQKFSKLKAFLKRKKQTLDLEINR